jgi:hypothetical protein
MGMQVCGRSARMSRAVPPLDVADRAVRRAVEVQSDRPQGSE